MCDACAATNGPCSNLLSRNACSNFLLLVMVENGNPFEDDVIEGCHLVGE